MNKNSTKVILLLSIVLILGLFFWGWSIYQEKQGKESIEKYDKFITKYHEVLFKECGQEYLAYTHNGLYKGLEGLCTVDSYAVKTKSDWHKYFHFYSEPLIRLKYDDVNVVYFDISRILNQNQSPFNSPRICIKADAVFSPSYAEAVWVSSNNISQGKVVLNNLGNSVKMIGDGEQTLICLYDLKPQTEIMIESPGQPLTLVSYENIGSLLQKGKLLIGLVGALKENRGKVVTFDVLAIPSSETKMKIKNIAQNNVVKYSTLAQIMKNIIVGAYTPPVIYQVQIPVDLK